MNNDTQQDQPRTSWAATVVTRESWAQTAPWAELAKFAESMIPITGDPVALAKIIATEDEPALRRWATEWGAQVDRQRTAYQMLLEAELADMIDAEQGGEA